MALASADPVVRQLTPGESALVDRVFGSSLDPAPVTLRRRKWWPGQPRLVTMAPDGHLWFHPQGPDWSADFATEGLAARAHFIHEMTHVWQHQQGWNLRLQRLPLARYRYLPLKPGRRFDHYGIEQQAEIVREAYMLAEGARLAGRPPLSDYLALLPFATRLS
jgi:hypothetical protein